MKNSTLMKLLECLHIRDYNLLVEENGFKMDFSQVGSQNSQSSIGKTTERKSKISSYLILVLLFLFTNFLFAQQQPACNLRGILESKRLRDGGENFTINSDVIRSAPGTIYRWEFKSNNSQATFVTANGQPNMTINPGNKNGEFNIKLTVINPPETRGASKTCSCTKSVSIGNVVN